MRAPSPWTRRFALGAGAALVIGVAAAACTFLSPLDHLQADNGLTDPDAETGVDGPRSEAETFAGGQSSPVRLALDADAVYWVNAGTHGILTKPKSGGTPRKIVSDPEAIVWLVVDPRADGFVYWASARQVHRIGKSAPSADAVVVYNGLLPVSSFVVDDSSQFVAEGEPGVRGSGRVTQARIDAGPHTILQTSDEATGIALDDTAVAWPEQGKQRVVFYAKDNLDAGVQSTFGAPVTDSVLVGGPGLFAFDAQAVYWATPRNGESSIRKHPRASGTQSIALVTAATSFVGLALDDASVWYVDENGTVARVLKDGGAPVIVATGQQGLSAIAVDASHVYFALQGTGTAGGTIKRVPVR